MRVDELKRELARCPGDAEVHLVVSRIGRCGYWLESETGRRELEVRGGDAGVVEIAADTLEYDE